MQRFVADATAEGHPIVLDTAISPATVIPCHSRGQAERIAKALNDEFVDLTKFERWRLKRRERRLTYCYKRCECGALYAIDSRQKAWDCSDIILGLAVPTDQPGSVRHGDTMPFIFWKVKEAPTDWAVAHRREAQG